VAGLEAIEAGSRAVGLGRASWLLAGATEEALPAGDPGARTPERGAVALVLEPAARLPARGVRGYGRCAAPRFLLPPRAAASAADRLRGRIPALPPQPATPEGRPHR
ncbi:3-oxoacyl-ACP synthase, partial [Streptomyces rubellomurinus subsp. indigoferus]